jgi:hypothetical protein
MLMAADPHALLASLRGQNPVTDLPAIAAKVRAAMGEAGVDSSIIARAPGPTAVPATVLVWLDEGAAHPDFYVLPDSEIDEGLRAALDAADGASFVGAEQGPARWAALVRLLAMLGDGVEPADCFRESVEEKGAALGDWPAPKLAEVEALWERLLPFQIGETADLPLLRLTHVVTVHRAGL